MKHFKLAFILLAMVGCSDINKKEVHYDSGKIFKVYYEKNGVPNGKFVVYYENGNIKTKGLFKNGKPNGVFTEYRDNNELKLKGQYKNGNSIGWFYYYEKGKIKRKLQYVVLNGKPYLNQTIIYDELGEIDINSSNYVSIEKSTFENEYLISLDAPMFSKNYFEIVVGNFDKNFKIKDDDSVDTIKVNGDLKTNISLDGNKSAILHDLKETDSIRMVKLIYINPSIDEYGFFENKN